MNKRQEKKLFKQTLIKIRKLHPQKGDVICFQPDLYWVDMSTMSDLMILYENYQVFGEATLVIVPANIEKLSNKERAQQFVDKLQSVVDRMGE